MIPISSNFLGESYTITFPNSYAYAILLFSKYFIYLFLEIPEYCFVSFHNLSGVFESMDFTSTSAITLFTGEVL